jgi:hypothetical protein
MLTLFAIFRIKEGLMMTSIQQRILLPYKNMAVGLLFSCLLGPLGLLYSSFLGGVILLPLGIFFIFAKFYFLVLMLWIVCCVWSVRAVENYNRKLLKMLNG